MDMLPKAVRRQGLSLAAASPGPPGKLVAEASADGHAFAALCATAAEHGGAALGLHAGPKAVSLNALAAVGLKCALGHGNALLNSSVKILLRQQIKPASPARTASLEYSAVSIWNPVWRHTNSGTASRQILFHTALFHLARRV